MDAARYYVAHLQAEHQKTSARTVQTYLDDWLRAKKAEADQGLLSTRTIQELESRPAGGVGISNSVQIRFNALLEIPSSAAIFVQGRDQTSS